MTPIAALHLPQHLPYKWNWAKVEIRRKVIFWVCELDGRKSDCSKCIALTGCRDAKSLAQAQCLKLPFTAVVYLKTISGETHTWNTATILITCKRKPSQHYYSLTLQLLLRSTRWNIMKYSELVLIIPSPSHSLNYNALTSWIIIVTALWISHL